jgi:hypothetical protein
MAAPRRRLIFGAGQLAPYSTAIAKTTTSAQRPLPQCVQRIQDHYQQSWRKFQAIADQGDTEMIDSKQARVTRLDQEVRNLINCCNNEKKVIEVEFDDI